MTGDSKQTGSSPAPKETPGEEGGLAPIARLILEKGFRTLGFQRVYEEIMGVLNRIARNDKVSEKELSKTLAAIEAHKKELGKFHDAEVVDIMGNYFAKLSQNLKASYVKAETPKTLEELKKTV
ncbi:MAG: hypothetical protein WC604_01120 [Candidatus Gracilibacteria bacterium]